MRGRQRNPGGVWYAVPVERVVISDDNFITAESSTPASIHLVDGRPSTLRCVAFGGYPPPSVELYVGRRDVTARCVQTTRTLPAMKPEATATRMHSVK